MGLGLSVLSRGLPELDQKGDPWADLGLNGCLPGALRVDTGPSLTGRFCSFPGTLDPCYDVATSH